MALFYSRVGSRNRVFQSGFLSVDCLIKTARTFSSQNSHVFRGFSDTVLTLKSLTDWSQGCLQMKKNRGKNGKWSMHNGLEEIHTKMWAHTKHEVTSKLPLCFWNAGQLPWQSRLLCYDFCRRFEAILHQFSEWLSIFFFDQISRPFYNKILHMPYWGKKHQF